MTKGFVGGRNWRLVLHDLKREQLEQQETHVTMLSNMSIFADWGLSEMRNVPSTHCGVCDVCRCTGKICG